MHQVSHARRFSFCLDSGSAVVEGVMLHNEEERSAPSAHVCVRRAHPPLLSAAAR